MDKTTKKRIREALQEDIGEGDLTSIWTIPEKSKSAAVIVAKQYAVISGLEIVQAVFKEADKTIEFEALANDGDYVDQRSVVIKVSGPTRGLLAAERTALNFLGRLSGVATLTRGFVDRVKGLGVKILDTRKTTPLWRVAERAAVVHGGGFNHRFGLFDQVLIKDNHVDAVGGVAEAIRAAKAANDKDLLIEVEVRNLDEVRDAVKEEPNIILLDNMSLQDIRAAVLICGSSSTGSFRRRKRVEIEASGGISFDNVRAIAKTGVDRISIGRLTHSAPAVDFSLWLEKQEPPTPVSKRTKVKS